MVSNFQFVKTGDGFDYYEFEIYSTKYLFYKDDFDEVVHKYLDMLQNEIEMND